MATLITNTNTQTTFTVALSSFLTIQVDVFGTGLVVNVFTEAYTAGTITGVKISQSGRETVSVTDFSTTDPVAGGLGLPADGPGGLNDFLTALGAQRVALDAPGRMPWLSGVDLDLTFAGTSGEDDITASDGDDRIFGGNGDDRLSGGEGSNVLFGGEGDDDLAGGKGPNTIFGGNGNDDIDMQTGNTAFGSGTPDVFVAFGDDGDDSILGSRWDDRAIGGNGADLIALWAGDDVARGQAGRDELFGGFGDDNLSGGRNSDLLFGGDALIFFPPDGDLTDDDLLKGGAGGDVVAGGIGNDRVFGGAGSDAVDGGRGSDLVRGGKGADVVSSLYVTSEGETQNGGSASARDLLVGGKGRDVFAFTQSQEGRVVVRDYKDGADMLQLVLDDNVSATADVLSVVTARDQYRLFRANAEDRDAGVLYEGDRGSVMIRGVTLDDLSADDFVTSVATVNLFL